MAENDHAILVGISRYADPSLRQLDGPVHDVRLMERWLLQPSGGGLPRDNVTAIVSDESPGASFANETMPPLFQDFLDAFMKLVRTSDRSGYIRREGSRLYLYFAGHGFCEKYNRDAHAALYVANADRTLNWNIYGTYFAQWVKDQGLFGEIVLIMDCCRDAELARMPLTPPLSRATDVGAGQDVRLFELYAAPRGGKAQERRIAARNNEVHGLLTHAFFDAFHHAAPGQTSVSTQAIKHYLEQRWQDICGDEPSDPPEVILPSNGEIVFERGAANDLIQRFRLIELAAGDIFEVLDGKFAAIATVTLVAGMAQVERPNGHAETVAIQDGVLTLPLPSGLYMAMSSRPGETIRRTFQAGGPDVEL